MTSYVTLIVAGSGSPAIVKQTYCHISANSKYLILKLSVKATADATTEYGKDRMPRICSPFPLISHSVVVQECTYRRVE